MKLLALTFACFLTACSCSTREQPGAFAPPQVAARVTALAAVLEAAAQSADPQTRTALSRFGLAPDRAFGATPERTALSEAVARWSPARKAAALAWVRENAAWTTMLHALAIESFGADLAPSEWAPTMRGFDPQIFARRDGLAPLLRDALSDPAITRIANSLSTTPGQFTHAQVTEQRDQLVRYLRIRDELPHVEALLDPLLAPTNGVNAQLPDGTVLFLVGPATDPADVPLVLAHEMAHQPVDRILRSERLARALDASACAFAKVQERYGYDSWRSFFAEALVRSLSYRLRDVPPRDTGLVWEAFLTERLRAYESRPDQSFEEAVEAMLRTLAADC